VKHPEIVKWVGLATVGLIGLGVTAKILVPVISALSWIYGVAGTALKLFGITVNTTNKLMMTTGIILIITAIAIAAYLIIKNWAKVKAFFIGLWNGVKMVFTSAWNFIKNLFLKYTPGGLIIRNWSKITAFFRGLWENVKGIFTGVWEWITGLAGRFWQAGKNIVVSIWNGIKAMINKPIEAVKGMVKKIRNLLPFSPAKEGPLKDIHRIKLVETIAASINASPMIKAMRGVVGDVANYGGSGLPSISRTNNHRSNFHLTYAPVVNGGSKADISAELRKHSKEIAGIVEEQMRKRDRTKF
jgi:phage-related protein